MRTYWRDDALQRATLAKGPRLAAALAALAEAVPARRSRRAAGAWRTAWRSPTVSWPGKVSLAAFERGLLVETACRTARRSS